MTASATDQRERELKFDVPDDWRLPDPAALAPDGGRCVTETVRLESAYFDTADQSLLHAGLTLRRRTGDIDAGWQLKVPDGDARIEIRLPLGGRGVPVELRDATLGVRGRAVLSPTVTIATEREIHTLLDAEDVKLAELVVDSVTATAAREPAGVRRWREVEVELLAGDEKLLARVARWLRKRGATDAAIASKAARAMGHEPPARDERGPVATVMRNYLDAQYEAILRGDIALRRGTNVVHVTRVATRRYRSILRVFGAVLDADAAAALDAELKWFAAVLGEVRDRDVLRGHLESSVAELPPELDREAVQAAVTTALAAERERAMAGLDAAMRSKRYFTLLRELGRWHAQLPLTGRARRADLAAFLAAAEKAVRKRQAAEHRHPDRDDAVHRIRKAAKRARYVGELCAPALGKPAERLVRRSKDIQTVLGERQDFVTAAAFLRRVPTSDPAVAFALGVLYARERTRAAETR
ncbi:MAG TPA: CYTH and CHAD domain-containing protein [Jatrophihabitans sp.]|jgi:CHAD domain-containing protein|uniref:CYTH and CHAD domain-containing protein n=1 Tax=Jatrophihabitans sp. TaxID=1932789 RepID=UPI002DF7B926|nr:CYTH and CHAD domain-containing protein [Jatrophihabitans sp.]